MQIIIKGKQMDIPPRLRQHIERKVQRLSRLVNENARVEITVTEEQTRSARDRYSMQVVLANTSAPIRSEVSAANALMALDLVLDKISAQLGRKKGRQSARRNQPNSMKVLALSRSGVLTSVEEETEDTYDTSLLSEPLDEQENEAIWSKVMEIQRVDTRPMNDQEVITYMEKHHLAYYPFFNEETRSVNVMYRLEKGGYGLLVPTM
jgi:putative sigma-54 modulation protein